MVYWPQNPQICSDVECYPIYMLLLPALTWRKHYCFWKKVKTSSFHCYLFLKKKVIFPERVAIKYPDLVDPFNPILNILRYVFIFFKLLLSRISIYFEIRFKSTYRVIQCNNRSIIAEKSQSYLIPLIRMRQCLPYIWRQNKNKFFDEIPHFSFNEFDPDFILSYRLHNSQQIVDSFTISLF